MSELAKTLELFGFLSIDDVTQDSLKKSFKTRILESHPDKGGDADTFDNMLHSYVYLTQTIQRISGGRATLQNILSPDELKRSDEIINQLFEEFNNDEFNQQFEKQKKETHGYGSWLKDMTEPSVTQSVKLDIIHPEEMAICSNLGTSIIENNCYTSNTSKPNYTDLYEAYTTAMITEMTTDTEYKEKTFDDIIAERNNQITPLNDDELKAIHEYEKKKLSVKRYTESHAIEDWDPNVQIKEYNNFFINV